MRLNRDPLWLAFWATVALFVLWVGLTAAQAAPPNAPCQRQGECREDPQEEGKDCEQHGKNPGGNQDHCDPAEVPSPGATPTPDITVPPPDDTVGPRIPADREVDLPGTPGASVRSASRAPTRPSALPEELPRTGITEALALVGAALLVSGALIRLAQAIVLHAAIQTKQTSIYGRKAKR